MDTALDLDLLDDAHSVILYLKSGEQVDGERLQRDDVHLFLRVVNEPEARKIALSDIERVSVLSSSSPPSRKDA